MLSLSLVLCENEWCSHIPLPINRMSLAQNWRRRGMFDEIAFVFPNAPMIPITVVCLVNWSTETWLSRIIEDVELWHVHAWVVRSYQAWS